MSYQSLYRKYRPASFTDVVGQKNIIQTLENSVKNNNIGHAYIFSGPRGCGKTSIAKIFARKVNCACSDNSCDACNLFDSKAEISDVWEIDAASNNGVDEIRRIIENVNYMPMDLKYKVYIIDEVHMLSKAAFNALLKTLEEPPEHVIFILATTEIYKIPLTVLSRCQRFDFKRIEVSDIVSRLVYVLDQEQIVYELEALEKIAKLADGAMRDALSIIEKVKSYNTEITISAVNSSLQLVGTNEMEHLLSLIMSGDLNQIVDYWQVILSQGIDENKFILDMQYYIRDLLLNPSSGYPKKALIYYLKTFSELDAKLQFTNNYSLLIEVYLIEMASHQTQSVNEQVQNTTGIHQAVPKNLDTKKQPESTFEYEKHQEKLKAQREQLLSSNPKIMQEPVMNQEPQEPVMNQEPQEPVMNQEPQEPVMNQEPQAPVMNQDLIADKRPTDVIDFLIGEEQKSDDEPIKSDVSAFNQGLHEELTSKSEINIEHNELKREPVVNENTNVVEQAEDNYIILDVLMQATVPAKKQILTMYPEIKSNLEESGKYGLAKFFEYSTIQAASEIGYVITIDANYIESYTKRLSEINNIFYKYTGKKGKIFLLEVNEWLTNRPEYINRIKELKEKDIYKKAQEEFGAELVVKI